MSPPFENAVTMDVETEQVPRFCAVPPHRHTGDDRTLWRRSRAPMLMLLVAASSSCASLSAVGSPPLEGGWVRETLNGGSTRCSQNSRTENCRTRLGSAAGKLEVVTKSSTYSLHEIPGWDDRSRAGRVLASVAEEVVLSLGGTSQQASIGIGTHAVSGAGAGPWRLGCSTFWIDDLERTNERRDGERVTRAQRRTEGMRCDVAASTDTAAVRWRFQAGIAPPRDSLAMVYDSLAASSSPIVGSRPPMSLERLGSTGEAEARYGVRYAWPRLTVTDEGGARLAVLSHGLRTTIDMAPHATEEERQVVRLVAVAFLTAPGRTGGPQ